MDGSKTARDDGEHYECAVGSTDGDDDDRGEIRADIKNATYSERCLEKVSGADGQHN